jgi:hypothetical protein
MPKRQRDPREDSEENKTARNMRIRYIDDKLIIEQMSKIKIEVPAPQVVVGELPHATKQALPHAGGRPDSEARLVFRAMKHLATSPEGLLILLSKIQELPVERKKRMARAVYKE